MYGYKGGCMDECGNGCMYRWMKVWMQRCWVHNTSSLGRIHSTELTLCKKTTIHQVITMLSTSKNVLFPGHNHLLTTSTDEPTL